MHAAWVGPLNSIGNLPAHSVHCVNQLFPSFLRQPHGDKHAHGIWTSTHRDSSSGWKVALSAERAATRLIYVLTVQSSSLFSV